MFVDAVITYISLPSLDNRWTKKSRKYGGVTWAEWSIFSFILLELRPFPIWAFTDNRILSEVE